MNAISVDEFKTLRKKAFQSARHQISATDWYPTCDDNTLEDLYSEAWLKILNGDREEVNGTFIAKKMVWLYGDLLRKQRAERKWFERYEQRREDEQHVQSAIAGLVDAASPGVREVMKRKFHGYTYDEIAAELDISKRTVNYRVDEFKKEAKHA